MKRLPVLVNFILFVVLCASTAYWSLQLWRPPVRQMAAPAAPAAAPIDLNAAASLFGGRPAAVGVASNYELKGVVVAGNGRESVAILSANGKPPQAVGLNTEFQPGVSVREVHPQYILLSEGGVIKRVALPEVAVAQQSSFNPNAGLVSTPAQMAPAMPLQAIQPEMPPPRGQPVTGQQLQSPLAPPGMQPSPTNSGSVQQSPR